MFNAGNRYGRMVESKQTAMLTVTDHANEVQWFLATLHLPCRSTRYCSYHGIKPRRHLPIHQGSWAPRRWSFPTPRMTAFRALTSGSFHFTSIRDATLARCSAGG